MNKLLKIINKTNFKIFLNRPYNLLTVEAHAQAYQERMKKIIDFYFNNLGYLGTTNLVEILRTDKEVRGLDEKIKKIIIKQPKSLLNILLIGKKYNKLMEKRTKKNKIIKTAYKKFNRGQLLKEFKTLFNIYADQFVTTTVVPFRAGLVLQELIKRKPLPQYKKLLSVVNKLRLVSTYAPFEKIVLGSLLREIARRNSLNNYSVLFNLMPDEIEKLIDGKLSMSENEIKKRNQYYIYFKIKNKDLLISGDRIHKKYKKLFEPKLDKFNLKKGITGSTAYPGKIKGRAKIVVTIKDMVKFIKGDILVTINANPRFMEVIKKAKAIITDEGGITCHAAIVSRELKIPCIIGTKIATKVLKDGDLVEVDATKGIVKKL